MIRHWLSHPVVDLAVKALGRNRLQTGLTMLGMTVGVATVLAMMAVGAGAQRSIEQQVRAAGLNQLTIRAGNWKPKQEDTGEAVAHQGDARDSLVLPVPQDFVDAREELEVPRHNAIGHHRHRAHPALAKCVHHRQRR